MPHKGEVLTDWGVCRVEWTEKGLVRLRIPTGRRRRLGGGISDRLPGGLGDRLRAYFEGRCVCFEDDVDLDGFGPFARCVLEELRSVEWGRTLTYGELARRAGRPGAARAVGGVMARNPLPIVLPCHRVLRADRRLGGFSAPGGERLKARLLSLEGAVVPIHSPRDLR